MRRHLPSLNSLVAFEAVGRNGNLQRAARELLVTHSAVSHQLRCLGEQVETALFEKNGRKLELTPRGRRLLETVTTSLDQIESVLSEINRDIGDRSLKIATTPAIASAPILEYVAEFIEQNQLADFSWVPIDQIDETVDLIISWRPVHVPGEKEVTHIHTNYFPVCSPGLLHRSDRLTSIEDLRGHILIHGNYDGADWKHFLAGLGHEGFQPKSHMYLGDTFVAHQAARGGCGIAIGDEILVDRDLREGSLVRALPISVPAPAPFCIVTPYHSQSSDMVQSFKRWFMRKVAETPIRAVSP